MNSWIEWKRFLKVNIKFIDNVDRIGIPFDPKFNTVHWTLTVIELCKEIAFSYCWLMAYAKEYKIMNDPGSLPAHMDFHVSYFSDNSITRINSCHDKIALMIWSYLCNFNPENRKEVLNFELIYERLKYPQKFGLNFKNTEAFLNILEKINTPNFYRMEQYRNLKIHRMEPRIEIYGVKSHHGWPYMIPLYSKKEILKYEKDKAKKNPNYSNSMIDNKVGDVLYDHRVIKDSIWGFDDVLKDIEECLRILVTCCSDYIQIIRRKSPLNKHSDKILYRR